MTTATPRRWPRNRYLIPAGLLAVLAGVAGWAYWRGTASEGAERDPGTAADGAVTQLLAQDGRSFLRSAIVIDEPPATVWQVIRDYDSQADFLPYLSQIASERTNDGRVRITGVAHSRVWGDWPFESRVREQEEPERQEYAVTWDEHDAGDFAVNRGGWRLTPAGDGGTLLVYTLQVEMKNAPDFLVRAVMRNRLGGVLRAVRDEVARRNPR